MEHGGVEGLFGKGECFGGHRGELLGYSHGFVSQGFVSHDAVNEPVAFRFFSRNTVGKHHPRAGFGESGEARKG